MARGWGVLPSGRAAGAGPGGFRQAGRGAQLVAQMTKCAADPAGRQRPPGPGSPFPGAAQVGGQVAGEPQLDVSGDQQPGPADSLLRVPDPGGGPPELGLQQLEGVLHVEAAQVGPPAHVQVRCLRPGMPQPHRAVRAAAVRQPLDADLDDGALDDRKPGVQLFVQPGEVARPLHLLVHAVPGPDLHPAVTAGAGHDQLLVAGRAGAPVRRARSAGRARRCGRARACGGRAARHRRPGRRRCGPAAGPQDRPGRA